MRRGMHHDHRIKGKCRFRNYIDELLEDIWIKTEEKGQEPAAEMEVDWSYENDLLERAISLGLVEKREEKVYLTHAGYERARQLIRSHRLAERLLADILNFSEDDVESDACRYEHFLDDSAVDSICTLLGHPRTCPHGKKIPEGRCCYEGDYLYRPLVVPLVQLEAGEEATVKYLGTADSAKLSYLTSFGFVPDQRIRLVRKKPAYVVQVDETLVSFNEEIARLIFVKPETHFIHKNSGKRWRWRWFRMRPAKK